ncbi:cyclin-D4-1-like isoform X2 [Chenopodium quinoa]|uniref:cyclin-D4-1-like isoform X2 n=1 Tax=Chenopodium quinoa TaxID=63459 RepID=UPI000B76FF53|nr:cyclin-D4-1-like isoform X2 [Chenopodium quinoa]
MAPSFDLLCAEDNSSIFDEVDDNYFGVVDDDVFQISYLHQQHGNLRNFDNININYYYNNNNHNQEHNFEALYSGFFVANHECLASLLENERQHFLGLDYLKKLRNGDLDLSARNLVIDWIQKVQSHYNFGPLCVYLSVNYLDRFLSAYELPGKAWMMQLIGVACLSLAAKVDETDVPLILDLQVCDSKFVFEAKTIQRMELLVLSTLKWRMQSVTPFSFIDYFLYKLSGDKMPPKSLIFQAIQLILSTIKGIDLMEFRPSEIAAAVAISVTQQNQIVECTDKAFSFLTDHLEKERLMKCVEMMQEMRMNNRSIGATSVPQSPIGVLDASACLSYKSDDASTSAGSCANSAHSSPASAPPPKRRKLDRTS